MREAGDQVFVQPVNHIQLLVLLCTKAVGLSSVGICFAGL